MKRVSEYPSVLLYILDQTHITVTATTALVLIYTRDAHVAWFAAGALGSSQLAKGIKRVIRQPRPPPVETPAYSTRPKKTYGMPSTHSTALTFFYAYLAPIYLQWSVPLTVAWVMGLWSRRELGYHTFAQIAAGAAIGAVAALTWHQIWLHNVDVIQAYWSLIIKYIQL